MDKRHDGTETSNKHESDHPPVQEYETLFHTMQEQLQLCQNEQFSLRSNLECLVRENQELSGQLQEEIRKNTSAESIVKSLNTNLKQQLDSAIQERNSAVDMWQTSLQLISALENELKDYRDNSNMNIAIEKVNEVRAEYSRAIKLLEEKLSAASTRLAKDKAALDVAEKKIEQLENDIKLLNERYQKRCSDVDEALIAKEIASKKLEELEKIQSDAVTEAKEAKLACSELEAALERSLSRLEEALNREAEAREKVDEALQIVETALLERDAALKQASQASDDAQQLRTTINEIIAEAGTEVQVEAQQIKEQYNNKIKTVLLDMRRLQVENKNRNSQIQKLKTDLSTMERELQKTKQELDFATRDRPSLSALDRKLEGLFRTQEIAGGDSIRADLELEQLRIEISKLTQSNDMEQRQFLLERQILEEQITLLQTDLENSSQIITECYIKIDALNADLHQKDYEIDFLKRTLSSKIHLHQDFNKRCLDEKNIETVNQHKTWQEHQNIYQELQSQLDNQRGLTLKWKSEVNLITSRFQSRLGELHSEASVLRKENRELHNKLQVSKHQENSTKRD